MGKGRTLRRPAMLEASVLETTYRKRGYTFRQITHFAPEQWVVYDDGPIPPWDHWLRASEGGKRRRVRKPRPPRLIGYTRLRHGYFSVNRATGADDRDMVLGEQIYEAEIGESAPCFLDWNVRVHYLSNALMALAGIKSPLPEYPGERATEGGV